MARPKGIPELSQEIRGGLRRYFMMEAEDGKPLSTIWRDIFEEDPVQGMRLAISLLPKELTIDQTVTLDATNLTPEDWAFVSEVRKTITDEHLTH